MTFKEKPLSQGPENGHTLLLLETISEHRTFSDYPTLILCLDTITALYEESRITSGLSREGYTINDLFKWMSGLSRIEVLVFNNQISRYQSFENEQLQDVFRDELAKLQDSC